VIYAATNGEGPALLTTPAGGRVWVTTDAGGGPNTWLDRTGSINPQGFPISSIVIDASDPSGQTAYAAIMGFHASHVWKTISAGLWWFDFSGNLPDAPADTLLIDPPTSTIYVGTDAGVFASDTANPNWIEVGPPVGQVGFLPNVAVTSLQLFDSGGSHGCGQELTEVECGSSTWSQHRIFKSASPIVSRRFLQANQRPTMASCMP